MQMIWQMYAMIASSKENSLRQISAMFVCGGCHKPLIATICRWLASARLIRERVSAGEGTGYIANYGRS